MPNVIIVRNDYPNAAALRCALNYVTRSGIIGGYAVAPDHAFREFSMVQHAFHNTEGCQLLHFIVSFSTTESYRMDTDNMLALGFEICRFFPDWQTVYALHLDASHPHLHFVVNRVSFADGRRYAGGLIAFWQIRDFLRQRFPHSDVRIYQSFSNSEVNRFGSSDNDELLRID